MTFLNPAFLWALPLALSPCILHLLFPRRAKPLPFGALFLLREVSLRLLPRARFKQGLLILTRCLMFLGLILAFARPVLRGAPGASGRADGEGLRLVVLVDASYSMGFQRAGKTRLAEVRRAADAWLASLQPRDRIALGIFADGMRTPLAWGSPGQARRLLGAAEVLPRPTDLLPALEAAYAFLSQEKSPRRGILVLSDNARHAFRHLSRLDRLPFYDPGVRVFGLAAPVPGAANAWVAGVELSGGRAEPKLKVRIGLSGPPRSDWGLRLFPQGRPGPERRLRLEEPWTETAFPVESPRDSILWGRLELQRDDLSADDVRYYAFRAPPDSKVLVLYGSPLFLCFPHGGYFLKEVFQAQGGSLPPFEPDFVDVSRFTPASLSSYRAVVLGGFKRLPPAVDAALADFVRKGGGLWALPEPGLERSFGLAGILPASLGPEENKGGALRLNVRDLPEPRPWRFRWRDFDIERLAVHRGFLALPKPGAKVWAVSSPDNPAWIYGRVAEGRVLLWAFPLDVDWTNVGLKPVFAPLVSACLGVLSRGENEEHGEPGENLMLTVGEPLARSWPSRADLPTDLSLLTPEGRRLRPALNGRRLEFSSTDQPGIYELDFVSGGRRRAEPFAVNLDANAGESELAVQSPLPPPWRNLDPDRLGWELEREFYGVEARTPLLYLVLLLFALEAFLSRRPRPALRAGLLLALLAAAPARAGTPEAQETPAGRFFWTQLKLGEDWDPYPGVEREVLRFLADTTSIHPSRSRRAVALGDPELFASPFLVLAGRSAPPDLTEEQIQRLRDYLSSGGFLWVEDVGALRGTPFDRWVRRTFRAVFPDSEFRPIPASHALYRSFYLLRSVAGRLALWPSLEGLDWGARTVVVYSRNDLLGAWARDALGQPLLPCVPGGQAQRLNARKVVVNIVLYALTGTYKLDAVHQPFILEKMRRDGEPPP